MAWVELIGKKIKLPQGLKSLTLDHTDCDVDLTDDPTCDITWIQDQMGGFFGF